MSSLCTLLVRLTLSLLTLASPGVPTFDSPVLPHIEIVGLLRPFGIAPTPARQDPAPCTVRGVLPAGSRIELRAPGSPDRKSAAAGDKGQYSLSVDAGRYEITWVQSSGKKFSETVWLSGPEVQLNAETASGSSGESRGALRLDGAGGTNASGQQYDLLADWRVTDRDGHGTGPSQVMLEVELTSGRTEKLSVWALSSLGDEEKETAGPLLTTPDGRVLFRVRDSRLRPDHVVALVVSVKGPGGETVSRRIAPVLEFSASGHLHAIYPDDLTLSLEKSAGKSATSQTGEWPTERNSGNKTPCFRSVTDRYGYWVVIGAGFDGSKRGQFSRSGGLRGPPWEFSAAAPPDLEAEVPAGPAELF